MRAVKFAVGGRLANWAVLLINDGNRDDFRGPTDPELQTVIAGFTDMCRKSGMSVDSTAPPAVEARIPPKDKSDPTRTKAISVIRETLRSIKKKPSIVLVILSNGDKHIYSGLKHLCDSFLGLATICSHAAKIRKERGQLQYFANVALKARILVSMTEI
jgi:eukaryotic translation initiation factor 2C